MGKSEGQRLSQMTLITCNLHVIKFICFFYGVEPRTLRVLGECSATQLHPAFQIALLVHS